MPATQEFNPHARFLMGPVFSPFPGLHEETGRRSMREAAIRSFSMGLILLLVGNGFPYVLFGTAIAQEQDVPPEIAGGLAGLPSPEKLDEQLADAHERLAGIPEGAEEGSVVGRRKASLERRVALLEEYKSVLASGQTRTSELDGLPDRQARVRGELQSFQEAGVPARALSPTREECSELKDQVSAQRERTTALNSRLAEQSERLETLPQLAAQARTRAGEAEDRASQLRQGIAQESDSDEKSVLEFRLENALLDNQIALFLAKALAEETKFIQTTESVSSDELDLAQKRLERLEQEFSLYGEALDTALASEQRAMEQGLARKEREAEEAATASARFLARYEAAILRSEMNASQLESFNVRLQKDLAEQEKRLAAEHVELEGLREYFQRPEVSAQASERLRLVRKQLKLRREMLSRSLRGDRVETLNGYRTRRFEIEDALFALSETWEQDAEAVLAQTPEADRTYLALQAEDIREDYRKALREEKTLLTEVITVGQQLQNIALARLDALSETEGFIRSKAFWLRDGKPLTLTLLRSTSVELAKLREWFSAATSTESQSQLMRPLRSPSGIVVGLLLFPILPAVLLYFRMRLRRFVARRNARAIGFEDVKQGPALPFIAAVIGAGLLPVYLLVAARTVVWLDLPAALSPIIVGLLQHMAYFLFFWFMTHSMLRQGGIAQAHFGMPAEAARSLRRLMRVLLSGYVVFLCAWSMLRNAPFEFEALPRLCYTAFELTGLVAMTLLVWPRSPFSSYALETLNSASVNRLWPVLRAVIVLLAFVILGLDAAGYRYAAQSLTQSFAFSLPVLLFSPPFYMMVTGAMEAIARRQRSKRLQSESGEGIEADSEPSGPMRRFIRVMFVALVLLLLARFWGVDQQTFMVLDEVHLHEIRTVGETKEYVTAADLLRFFLYIAVMSWLLRSLPGIYEFTIFPRIQLDQGAKYALLTMSRYGIFAVGIFMALAEIHLDLGRLGWLMAALGIGLGFGLQEIVSNFVSGIILLVERPIQVNDIVTIGSMSGTVRRINIRATTILNFDQQEVVLPNRNLITQEVTNWTRGNTVNRLVINIGVAYGSNVDEVSDVLLAIAREDPDVLDEPPTSVVFMEHGESSLNFALRVFIPSPALLMPTRDRLNKAINRVFAERDIEIPFPQRDLHIRSGGEALKRHSDSTSTDETDVIAEE